MRKQLLIGAAGLMTLSAAVFLGWQWQGSQESYYTPRNSSAAEASESAHGAAAYWHQLRANQETGEIDPADVNRANQALANMPRNKQNPLNLQWELMGPTNLGGRTRAFIFDKDNPATMYMGAVSGGLFKSNNGGRTWFPLAEHLSNMAFVSLHQASDGTLYAGTGEGLYYFASGSGSGGIMGAGIFKSTDDGQTWTQLPSTAPSGNNRGTWTSVGKIFSDPNNADRIYAATNGGLRVSDDAGQTWSRAINGRSATDLTVASDGTVWVKEASAIYKSSTGDANSYTEVTGTGPLTRNNNRMRIAVSPQDPNYVYVVAIDQNGRFFEAYQSKDGGDSWQVIGSRNTLLNPHRNQGEYDNAVAVDPDNKERIIVGGVELWEWSANDGWQEIATLSRFAINFYVHADKHEIKYHPNKSNTLYIASDGGLFKSSDDGFTYTMENKGYSTIQFYGMDVGLDNELLGGTQDNSNIFVDPSDLLPKNGDRVFSGDGGLAALSKLNPNLWFLASQYGNLARSIDDGENFISFYGPRVTGNRARQIGVSSAFAEFVTPFDLHEELNDPDSEDSIRVGADTISTSIGFGNGGKQYSGQFTKPQSSTKFIAESFEIRAGNQVLTSDASGNLTGDGSGSFNEATGSFNVDFDQSTSLEIFISVATRYDAGAPVVVESATNEIAIRDTIPQALNPGEEYFVIDPVQSIFAVGLTAYDNIAQDQNTFGGVWMTREAVSKTNGTPEWWHVGELNSEETPTVVEISPDGDMIFVGTNQGRVIRISNLDQARSEETADIDTDYSTGNPVPSNAVVQQDVVFNPGRAINGIGFDHEDPDKVLITLGNYGNSDYLYYTDQGKSPNLGPANFRNVTGNLPPFPTYDAVFNYNQPGTNNTQVVVGTDKGIFTTDDITASSPTWTQENNGMAAVPVFDLHQQKTVRYDLKTNQDFEGAIYAATHGRGIFKTTTTADFVGLKENTAQVEVEAEEQLLLYPNPAQGQVKIGLSLAGRADVDVQVRSLSGQLVLSRNFSQVPSTQETLELNTSSLSPGVYLVTTKAPQYERTGRLVIQR